MAERADAPRDLCLALLAIERGLIDPDQLVAAIRIWVRAKRRAMAEILAAQGMVDGAEVARLERLLAEPLEPIGGRRDGGEVEAAGPPGDPDPSATVTHIGSASSERGAPRGDKASDGLGIRDEVGRYRILRPHARGGLGEVFLALDPELNRTVALKELPAQRADDPAHRARFLLEAEVTGRLEHPGIVPVYGLGRYADGRPYYAMRFIQGETLRDAIEQFHNPAGRAADRGSRELAFRRLLRSVIDACNAVAYAHSRGVVHRDLKPENIMLGRFGETLVVDWGVAKPIAGPPDEPVDGSPLRALAEEVARTLAESVIGTPKYMSPEQAAGDHARVGPASDVYGLGATLYCVLVGRAPFPNGDLRRVLGRVRRGIFPAPRRVRRSVDPALEAICLKAMALEPQDRHASPLELAHELEAWLADARYRGEQEQALSQMKGSLARLCFERAQVLLAREMRAEGMLWLARALEHAPAEPAELQRAVRTSLSGWHAPTRLLERGLSHRGEVHAVAFSPDGRRLATASADGTARLWDVATGAALSTPMTHGGPVQALAFSPDGRSLATASADGMISRWDALSGELVGTFARGGSLAALHFSPDGSMIATVGDGGGPLLWDIGSGRPVPSLPEPGAPVLVVAFSPDGRWLAAACDDGRVYLWDTATGLLAEEPLPHEAAVSAVAFSPDGRSLLTGRSDGKVHLWEIGRRGALATLAHQAGVSCAAFSPLGAVLATACEDGTARLWEAATGRPIGEPLLHRARVDRLAFGPDGALLATACKDWTVRLWCAATGLPIAPPLEHWGDVHALAFGADGRRLSTGCSDGMARCWRVPTPVDGEPERIVCWVRVETDLEFDEGDAIRRLDGATSWELRRRLIELGGPPSVVEGHKSHARRLHSGGRGTQT